MTTYEISILIIMVFTASVAIGIPCCLANKQNKIALFQKRFEVYEAFIDLETYCTLIYSTEHHPDFLWRHDIRRFLLKKQVTYSIEDHSQNNENFGILNSQITNRLRTFDLLFSMGTDDTSKINEILNRYVTFCNMTIIMDSQYTYTEQSQGKVKAVQLYISRENYPEKLHNGFTFNELETSYIRDRNALANVFATYQNANISQKLRSQLQIIKPPRKCITCIKNIFCGKD